MEIVSKKVKKHNFSAGPAILPTEVIEQSANAVLDLNGSGLSLLEISHRSPEFVDIMDKSVSLVKDLLNIPNGYEVLFLTGGASSQFFMTAMNLLGEDQKAAYVDTGSWSSKAIKEAKAFGTVEVLASSKESNYNFIPKNYSVPKDAVYLHLTSNNTIYGTEYHWWPDTKVPFVCDMSSDIFSRPIDVSRFALIYAGAQKNMGPAGTTLVIVKKDVLGKVSRKIPTILNYNTHIEKNSAYNTPPVYAIYVSMLTMQWLKKMGGVAKMEQVNKEKAALLYREIDNNPCFKGTAAKEDRSLMNVTFVPTDSSYEAPFLELCKAEGIVGIKGHRSVGGFRASIYNAMPVESIQFLVDTMKQFAKKVHSNHV